MTYGLLQTETMQPETMTPEVTKPQAKAQPQKKRMPKAGRVLLLLLVVCAISPALLLRKTVKNRISADFENGFETDSETVSKPQETALETLSRNGLQAGDTVFSPDGTELVVQKKGGRPSKKKPDSTATGS